MNKIINIKIIMKLVKTWVIMKLVKLPKKKKKGHKLKMGASYYLTTHTFTPNNNTHTHTHIHTL